MKNCYIVNSSNFFLQIKNCQLDTNKLIDCKIFENKEEMYDYLINTVKYNDKYIENQELLITSNVDGKPMLCHLDGYEIELIEECSVETYISFLHG